MLCFRSNLAPCVVCELNIMVPKANPKVKSPQSQAGSRRELLLAGCKAAITGREIVSQQPPGKPNAKIRTYVKYTDFFLNFFPPHTSLTHLPALASINAAAAVPCRVVYTTLLERRADWW